MQVTVTFRRIEATDSIRDYADAKVRRVVSKYFRRPLEGHVVLSVSKRRHSAEITVVADRLTLNAKEETGDLYAAIDLAMDKIERQAKKRKTKRQAHKAPASVPLTISIDDESSSAAQSDDETDWLAVIGKSLSFLCLCEADLRDKELLPQATLLESLGLSRKDAAEILGTTSESVRVTQHRARTSKRKTRTSPRSVSGTPAPQE